MASIVGPRGRIVTIYDTTYTLRDSDNGNTLCFDNASPITVTIPLSLQIGWKIVIVQQGAGVVTVAGQTGVTINNLVDQVTTGGQWACLTLTAVLQNNFVLGGDAPVSNTLVIATGSTAPVSLADRFAEIVNVKDFGAQGDWDGSTGTDDLAAFDAAYARALAITATTGAGCKIWIPRGRYLLSDEWNIYRPSSPRRDIIIAGEDQLSTELVADFYGADKALIRCVDQLGVSRASPTSIRDMGFENVSTSGGVTPVFIDVLGYGESRIDQVRFGASNNTHLRLASAQNVRGTDIVSFFGGRHFNYKDTDGFTFDVDTSTNTITASAPIFSAGDVGKYFFIFPSDVTRRIRYTIATVPDSTHATYVETTTDLTETGAAGHFEPARCSITDGTATLTADADVFTPDMVGLVLYIRGARAGTNGTAMLRAVIASYTAPDEVELDTDATATATDEFFGVAALDFGLPAGFAGSSDVQIDKLHIEHYDGVALVIQNADTYMIKGKIHGETSPTDAAASMAGCWFDDVDGRFEVFLDSSVSMSDTRVYACNLNSTLMFDAVQSRFVLNGTVFKSELITDSDGYVIVRGLTLTDNLSNDPTSIIADANFAADETDPRILYDGVVDMHTDSSKPRHYVGRGSYYEPTGRFISFKRRTDTALTATVTWNGTPPSGTETKRYRWEQLGSLVYFSMRLEYTVAGANNSSVDVALPADMPPPQLLSGTSSAEIVAANIVGIMATAPSGAVPNLTKSYMIGDGAGGYILTVTLNSSTVSAQFASISGYYFTS